MQPLRVGAGAPATAAPLLVLLVAENSRTTVVLALSMRLDAIEVHNAVCSGCGCMAKRLIDHGSSSGSHAFCGTFRYSTASDMPAVQMSRSAT